MPFTTVVTTVLMAFQTVEKMVLMPFSTPVKKDLTPSYGATVLKSLTLNSVSTEHRIK